MDFFCVALLSAFLLNLCPSPSSCFFFPRFVNEPSLESQIALFGDAFLTHADFSIQITCASVPSSGSIIYTKPLALLDQKTATIASFSTYFSFLTPPGSDGIDFVVFTDKSHLESDKTRVLTVRLKAPLKNAESKCSSGAGGGLARICVLYALSAALNSGGEKLHSWVDYDSRAKMLEVRLSKSDAFRPSDPSISLPTDFPAIWRGEAFVGVSSSSVNSTVASRLYSWSFKSISTLNSLHSEPLDPSTFLKNTRQKPASRKSDYVWSTLTALVLGVGFGAGIIVLLMLAWSFVEKQLPIASKEYPVHPVDFECEKMITIAIKGADDGKK